MSLLKAVFSLLLLAMLAGCNSAGNTHEQDNALLQPAATEAPEPKKQVPADTIRETAKTYALSPDTAFVVLAAYAQGFAYNMKYATADNFLETAVYPCAQCLVRKEVADALIKANESLRSRGLRIQFWDCYRPLDIQKKMWEIYPNPRYVANPYASGSMHNRGGAVDITLVDERGHELEMGTPFDHFGKEAHHAYTNLPDSVRANRILLKETMEAAGFQSITSEWWHYSFKATAKYGLSNFSLPCE